MNNDISPPDPYSGAEDGKKLVNIIELEEVIVNNEMEQFKDDRTVWQGKGMTDDDEEELEEKDDDFKDSDDSISPRSASGYVPLPLENIPFNHHETQLDSNAPACGNTVADPIRLNLADISSSGPITLSDVTPGRRSSESSSADSLLSSVGSTYEVVKKPRKTKKEMNAMPEKEKLDRKRSLNNDASKRLLLKKKNEKAALEEYCEDLKEHLWNLEDENAELGVKISKEFGDLMEFRKSVAHRLWTVEKQTKSDELVKTIVQLGKELTDIEERRPSCVNKMTNASQKSRTNQKLDIAQLELEAFNLSQLVLEQETIRAELQKALGYPDVGVDSGPEEDSEEPYEEPPLLEPECCYQPENPSRSGTTYSLKRHPSPPYTPNEREEHVEFKEKTTTQDPGHYKNHQQRMDDNRENCIQKEDTVFYTHRRTVSNISLGVNSTSHDPEHCEEEDPQYTGGGSREPAEHLVNARFEERLPSLAADDDEDFISDYFTEFGPQALQNWQQKFLADLEMSDSTAHGLGWNWEKEDDFVLAMVTPGGNMEDKEENTPAASRGYEREKISPKHSLATPHLEEPPPSTSSLLQFGRVLPHSTSSEKKESEIPRSILPLKEQLPSRPVHQHHHQNIKISSLPLPPRPADRHSEPSRFAAGDRYPLPQHGADSRNSHPHLGGFINSSHSRVTHSCVYPGLNCVLVPSSPLPTPAPAKEEKKKEHRTYHHSTHHLGAKEKEAEPNATTGTTVTRFSSLGIVAKSSLTKASDVAQPAVEEKKVPPRETASRTTSASSATPVDVEVQVPLSMPTRPPAMEKHRGFEDNYKEGKIPAALIGDEKREGGLKQCSATPHLVEEPPPSTPWLLQPVHLHSTSSKKEENELPRNIKPLSKLLPSRSTHQHHTQNNNNKLSSHPPPPQLLHWPAQSRRFAADPRYPLPQQGADPRYSLPHQGGFINSSRFGNQVPRVSPGDGHCDTAPLPTPAPAKEEEKKEHRTYHHNTHYLGIEGKAGPDATTRCSPLGLAVSSSPTKASDVAQPAVEEKKVPPKGTVTRTSAASPAASGEVDVQVPLSTPTHAPAIEETMEGNRTTSANPNTSTHNTRSLGAKEEEAGPNATGCSSNTTTTSTTALDATAKSSLTTASDVAQPTMDEVMNVLPKEAATKTLRSLEDDRAGVNDCTIRSPAKDHSAHSDVPASSLDVSKTSAAHEAHLEKDWMKKALDHFGTSDRTSAQDPNTGHSTTSGTELLGLAHNGPDNLHRVGEKRIQPAEEENTGEAGTVTANSHLSSDWKKVATKAEEGTSDRTSLGHYSNQKMVQASKRKMGHTSDTDHPGPAENKKARGPSADLIKFV